MSTRAQRIVRAFRASRAGKLRRRLRNVRKGRIGKANSIYRYRQEINGISITGIGARFIQQAGAPSHYAVEIRADAMSNWANFAALYDQYRIDKVTLVIMPMVAYSNATSAAGTITNGGVLALVTDYDDSTVLASYNAYLEYTGVKVVPSYSTKVIRSTIKPAIRVVGLESGGAQVATEMKKSPWLDCATGAITHNGYKIYLDQYGSINAPQTYQINMVMHVSFKNVR